MFTNKPNVDKGWREAKGSFDINLSYDITF
jgi:hypothetical protein